MNINGLVVNGTHCGVVDDNGSIRILVKKNTDAIENFEDYLELDNQIIMKKKEIVDTQNSIKKNKKESIINLIETLVPMIAFITLKFGFNMEILLLGKVLLSLSSLTLLGLGINKIKTNARLNNDLRDLKKEYKSLKNEFQKVSSKMTIFGELDNVFEPRRSSHHDSYKNICDSSNKLYHAMETYLYERENKNIYSYKVISLKNDYINNAGDLIYVPNFDVFKDFFEKEELNRKMYISNLLELRYNILNQKDEINTCKQKVLQKIKNDSLGLM